MSKLNCDELLKMTEESGSVSLADLKKLPLKDLEEFFDEIRTWCIYSSGDKKKLKKKKKIINQPNYREMKTYNILFLCTGNSARSIIGEMLASSLSHGKFIGYSAGSKPRPNPHPLAIELANKLNYPLEKLRSKSWDEFAKPDAPQMDFIITVCDDAADEVCPVWPGHPANAHWGFPDPASASGNDEQVRHAFEQVEIGLRNRIELLLDLPIDTIDHLSLKRELSHIHSKTSSSS